jgi:uncharacterized protein (DUF1015 family)
LVNIQPFKAWRFPQTLWSQVTAPPFDAIDGTLQQQLWQQHSCNVVRLTRPLDGPHQAATFLQHWQQQGHLNQDTVPTITLYRQHWQGQTRTGMLALLDLRQPEQVVPHEDTLYGPIQDRLALLQTTGAQVCPLFLLHPGPRLPDYPLPTGAMTFTDTELVTHQVWPVTDGYYIQQVQAMLALHPLLIADGHHRYATLQQFYQQTGQPYALVFLAHLDDVAVLPTHRGFKPLPFNLLAAMRHAFEPGGDDLCYVSPTINQAFKVPGDNLPVVALENMLAQHHTHSLSLRDANLLRFYPQSPYSGLSGYDVAQHGLAALIKVKPPRLEQVLAYCQTGQRLPLKSTYIVPKPLSGLAIYIG